MAVGDTFPGKVIPHLLQFYVDPKFPELERLKLGEVIFSVHDLFLDLFGSVQCTNCTMSFIDCHLDTSQALLFISKRCGETLPLYASHLMNGFLHATKDKSSSIRASSLSNLAELCKHMRFALHPYIIDIIQCVTATLKTDREAEVRRGKVVYIYRPSSFTSFYCLKIGSCHFVWKDGN
jgi:hypothetical protein